MNVSACPRFGSALALAVCQLVLSLCAGSSMASEATDRAKQIMETTGVRGGLIVQLGCGDGQLTAALRAGDGYLVQGLDADAANVERARAHLRSLGLYGPASVEPWEGRKLPYTDNLVNLIVAEDRRAVSDAELLRVLAPDGTAYVKQDGAWKKITKPRPPDIDDWTHYLHDASNNAVAHDTVVGPPRHVQWVSGPSWVRHHDHVASVNAMVSAGGRLFAIVDEAPTVSILLPPKWSLVASDAFNGTVLWKRPIPDWVMHLWPLKSGPAQLPRRLVAAGDRVFVTLGIDAPLSMLDAATGATVRTYPDTKGAEEVIFSDGLLFVVANQEPNAWNRYRVESLVSPEEKTRVGTQWNWDEKKRLLLAVEAQSGAVRWKKSHPVAPLTLAADGRGAYFYDGRKIVALDRDRGEPRWESATLARRPAIAVNYAPNLVVCDDVVLFAGGDRAMTAVSTETGKTLWTAPHPASGYCSPEDLFVVKGNVWAGNIPNSAASGLFTQRDLLTGRVLQEFAPDDRIYHFPHHRCYRSKATDLYILASRTGIEFIDTRTGHWTDHHWVRGGCLYGLMPCNGLVYTPPHYCACFATSKLNGFCALAPQRKAEAAEPGAYEEQRLQRGPAYAAAIVADSDSAGPGASDWPTYRHDAARSGATAGTVSADLQVAWETSLGGRVTAPTIAEGKVFVAQADAHTIHALDAANGSQRWRFMAGARVDSPPTIHRGRVLFGSADGCVYCLRASDGQLAWRFRAAPEQRWITAAGQLESAWPVHGSVLVANGELYCVAGRSMFVDGGLRFLRLDPVTGRKLSEVTRNEIDPGTGRNLQYEVNKTRSMRIPVALPDILAGDGSSIIMRGSPFDFGRAPAIESVTPAGKPKRPMPLIKCAAGLLDDSWMNRLGWSCGRSPLSRILVFDRSRAYGFGFRVQYQRLTPYQHHLYAAGLYAPGPAAKGGQAAASLDWSQPKLPLLVRAMVLAGDTLFVAGPPDLGMTADETAYRGYTSPERQALLRQQAEAWEGRRGGLLWAVSKADGRRLAEHKLDTTPAWDGMAAAGGRLYLSTIDGKVLCLGNP